MDSCGLEMQNHKRRAALKAISATVASIASVGTAVATSENKPPHTDDNNDASRSDHRIIENFEDGTLADYIGDVDGFTIQTDVVKHGHSALKGVGGNNTIISTRGLRSYPEQGDTFEVHTQLTNVDSGVCLFYFGAHDANNHYRIALDPNTNQLKFVVVDSGRFTRYTTSCAFHPNIWYRVKVDWQTDGTITASLHAGDDKVTDISATDTTFTNGGIGFQTFNLSTRDTNYWDLCRMTLNNKSEKD